MRTSTISDGHDTVPRVLANDSKKNCDRAHSQRKTSTYGRFRRVGKEPRTTLRYDDQRTGWTQMGTISVECRVVERDTDVRMSVDEQKRTVGSGCKLTRAIRCRGCVRSSTVRSVVILFYLKAGCRPSRPGGHGELGRDASAVVSAGVRVLLSPYGRVALGYNKDGRKNGCKYYDDVCDRAPRGRQRHMMG